MRDREKRCSECLQLQDKEMESPYVCEECEEHTKMYSNNFESFLNDISTSGLKEGTK